MSAIEVLTLVGGIISGLALFLYGMNVMSAGLTKASGGKLEQFLSGVTKNRLTAYLFGVGVTALVQSSSASTSITIGLVRAGLMNLEQGRMDFIFNIVYGNTGLTDFTYKRIARDRLYAVLPPGHPYSQLSSIRRYDLRDEPFLLTKYYDDGSAIKYTNSKWMSPSGVWVNNTGIAPDVEVKLPDILTSTYADFGEDESYAPDSVSDRVAEMEKCLQYLGYDVDRTDGYFSDAAEAALLQFASDHELESDGTLNQMMYNALLTDVVSLWLSDETRDTQLMKGIELLNGSEDTAAVRQRSARC